MTLAALFETIAAPIVTVGSTDIARLKVMAKESGHGRFRLCAHDTTDHPLQEMFICAKRHTYMVPHKHPKGRSESYFLLEGDADIYILSEQGQVERKIALSANDPEKARFFRVSEPLIHFVFPVSDWLIYHEVFTGPWVKDEVVIIPSFAPDGSNSHDVRQFVQGITGVDIAQDQND